MKEGMRAVLRIVRDTAFRLGGYWMRAIIGIMKKAAILYDFDKTLCTKDMQEYSLIPSLGYESAGDFWNEVNELTTRNEMDGISAYLYMLHKKMKENRIPLTKESFRHAGEAVELYPGVMDWFDRVNEYGMRAGLHVEHFIISSGMAEIIEGTPIKDEFERIYACRYYYDKKTGTALWPAQIVNYTTKTQYIFRVNKYVLDVADDKKLNEYVDQKDRPVPFSRMVYVGDGLTDVPCMRLVKEYGGRSIAVYSDKDHKSNAERLMRDGRVNFMCNADYSEGSDMEKLMFQILDHMKADEALKELEGLR